MCAAVIAANGLSKTFRDGVVAVNDLDLKVERGAVYGLMGRNGSGKTTTLRLLLGLLQPDQGRARVLGWDFWLAPRSVRTRAAYVPQTQQLPASRSLEELNRCLKRFNEQWDQSHARALANAWGLPWKRPLGCLSSGGLLESLAFASRIGVGLALGLGGALAVQSDVRDPDHRQLLAVPLLHAAAGLRARGAVSGLAAR